MVFPVVMYECESWTVKKAERRRIDSFKLGWWRRLLRVPWTARISNHSILKKIGPEYSLKGLTLKLQYFGHLMWSLWLIGKDLITRKDWRQEEKGMTEDEMVGWHHWLNGHEFEQTLGDGERQGSLACCSPWGYKESDMAERLNHNKWESNRHLLLRHQLKLTSLSIGLISELSSQLAVLKQVPGILDTPQWAASLVGI